MAVTDYRDIVLVAGRDARMRTRASRTWPSRVAARPAMAAAQNPALNLKEME